MTRKRNDRAFAKPSDYVPFYRDPELQREQKQRQYLQSLNGAKTALRAWRGARRAGHEMAKLEPDVCWGAYVSYCTVCGLFLAYDAAEGPDAFGGVAEGPCKGSTAHGPADRRAELDVDIPLAVPRHEPADASPQDLSNRHGKLSWYDENTDIVRRSQRRKAKSGATLGGDEDTDEFFAMGLVK